MRSIRRTTITLLLALLLIPGLLQAHPAAGAAVNGPAGLFDTVWNLLAFFWPNSGSASPAKNGAWVDPAGSTTPPPSGSTGTGSTSGATAEEEDPDSGANVDPAGNP